MTSDQPTHGVRVAGLPPGVETGPLGKRFVASLIDAVVPALVAAVASALLRGDVTALRVLLAAVCWVLAVAWWLAVWWMFATRAAGPGMRVMGLQLVGLANGRPIGWWRFLLRWLLLVALVLTVVGVLVMIIFLVRQPRRQGWHDLAVNAVVIKERPVPRPQARRSRDGDVSAATEPAPSEVGAIPSQTLPSSDLRREQPVGPVSNSSQMLPEGSAAHHPVASANAHPVVARRSLAEPSGREGVSPYPLPARGQAMPQYPRPVGPPDADRSAAPPEPYPSPTSYPLQRTTSYPPRQAPTHQSSQPVTYPPQPVPYPPPTPAYPPEEAQPSLPQPSAPDGASGPYPVVARHPAPVQAAEPTAAVPAGAPSVGSEEPSVGIEDLLPSPAQPPVDRGGPPDLGPGSADRMPAVAAADNPTTAAGTSAGASGAVTATGSSATGVDADWLAALDDGRQIPIAGLVLLGRNPQPRPGEEKAQLIKVADASRTVSKSHLEMGVNADGMYVLDRGSTNGSTVTNVSGVSKRCPPGELVAVSEGSIVSFGDHWLEVRRA